MQKYQWTRYWPCTGLIMGYSWISVWIRVILKIQIRPIGKLKNRWWWCVCACVCFCVCLCVFVCWCLDFGFHFKIYLHILTNQDMLSISWKDRKIHWTTQILEKSRQQTIFEKVQAELSALFSGVCLTYQKWLLTELSWMGRDRTSRWDYGIYRKYCKIAILQDSTFSFPWFF